MRGVATVVFIVLLAMFLIEIQKHTWAAFAFGAKSSAGSWERRNKEEPKHRKGWLVWSNQVVSHLYPVIQILIYSEK